MSRSPALEWLSERTRTGVKDLPSNAGWLLSRARHPADAVGSAAESAAAGARDRGRRMTAAVADASPVGDSIDIRMKRARDAAERAREAEEEAVEAARESKERADHLREASERGAARVTEVERESAQDVEQRVADAQKAADESVRREREQAEADAQERVQETQSEVDGEVEDARRDAQASQERAEALVQDATEKLAEARELAEDATAAAREAAAEAHRQAEELAGEARQQAGQAEARVSAAEQLREHSEATARDTARELQGETTNGGLASHNKRELVELAAGIGIEGRTTMTKAELVRAITRASKAKATR